VDVAFSSLTTNTPPTPTAVQVISDVVTKVVEAWLNAENVPTAGRDTGELLPSRKRVRAGLECTGGHRQSPGL